MRRCRWAADCCLSLGEGRVAMCCGPAQHFLGRAGQWAACLGDLLRALLGKALGTGVWPSAACGYSCWGWQSYRSGPRDLSRLGGFRS